MIVSLIFVFVFLLVSSLELLNVYIFGAHKLFLVVSWRISYVNVPFHPPGLIKICIFDFFVLHIAQPCQTKNNSLHFCKLFLLEFCWSIISSIVHRLYSSSFCAHNNYSFILQFFFCFVVLVPLCLELMLVFVYFSCRRHRAVSHFFVHNKHFTVLYHTHRELWFILSPYKFLLKK